MIKQLLNSNAAEYRDFSMSRRSIVCLSLWLRQVIACSSLLKSGYFAQPRVRIIILSESPDHLRNHVDNVDKHHKELSQICLHAAVSDTPLSDCLTSLDQTYGNFNEQRQLNFLKDSKKINSPCLLAQSASMMLITPKL